MPGLMDAGDRPGDQGGRGGHGDVEAGEQQQHLWGRVCGVVQRLRAEIRRSGEQIGGEGEESRVLVLVLRNNCSSKLFLWKVSIDRNHCCW